MGSFRTIAPSLINAKRQAPDAVGSYIEGLEKILYMSTVAQWIFVCLLTQFVIPQIWP